MISFFSLHQIQRYAIVIVVLLALLLLLLLAVKLADRFRRRRHGTWAPDSSTNRHLTPVGDRGLLVNRRDAQSKHVGFTVDQIPGLGETFKCGAVDSVEVTIRGQGESGEEGAGMKRECIVCLVEYEQGELLRKLHACGHVFHQDCVEAWLSTHRSCPFCRTPLSLSEEPPPTTEPHP